MWRRLLSRLGLCTRSQLEAAVAAARAEGEAQVQQAAAEAAVWEHAWHRVTEQYGQMYLLDQNLMRQLAAELNWNWELHLIEMDAERMAWLIEARSAARQQLEFVEHCSRLRVTEQVRKRLADQGADPSTRLEALLAAAEVVQSIPNHLRHRVCRTVARVDADWWFSALNTVLPRHLDDLLAAGRLREARQILSDLRYEALGIFPTATNRYWEAVLKLGTAAELADFLGLMSWEQPGGGYDRDLLMKEVAAVCDIFNAVLPTHSEIAEFRRRASLVKTWMFTYARDRDFTAKRLFGEAVVSHLTLVETWLLGR